jgi:hypothetical protein
VYFQSLAAFSQAFILHIKAENSLTINFRKLIMDTEYIIR